MRIPIEISNKADTNPHYLSKSITQTGSISYEFDFFVKKILPLKLGQNPAPNQKSRIHHTWELC